MDDTTGKISVAAATRKRRSSILKSQRPPRTPFSELEFQVATPTDNAKSRRVSFSRRTGVAEFITNEGTTTWKSVYEEHNKSLESSGNESAANAGRPTIGHIGKRIFDQQFEEVEVVDFGGSLIAGPARSQDFNTSINNGFTQQLASIECTDDIKLPAPQQNFELSTFTDHQSKLFSDDLSIPVMGELTNQINVNFSVIQPIGDKVDDLDEIQRDLERSQNNVVCAGPLRQPDMSEYIEVDFNMTHVGMKNDVSDMSITDTILGPKVQKISKNNTTLSNDKDWSNDKENIVVNPYSAPCESDNFALNESADKVLVFDGKRLTVQSDKAEIPDEIDYRKSILNTIPDQTPKRKTIVLNMNDDLPNFITNTSELNYIPGNKGEEIKQDLIYGDENLPSIQTVDNNVNNTNKRKTIVFDENIGNMSVTQALSVNVIIDKDEFKRKTIIYEDDGNMSVTQAISSKVDLGKNSEKRRTIVYEDNNCNISMTQALPSNMILNQILNKSKTVVVNDSNEKRRTIVFENDNADISMTQTLPANVILNKTSEKRKTIVYEDDNADISITQAIPSNVILGKKSSKRQTILYENDMADVSITQALPSNVILSQMSDKSKTVVYEDDNCDISMTQVLPSNMILGKESNEKRRTIVFENNDADISMTQSLPANVILNKTSEKRKTIVYEDDNADISITQAIPSNVILSKKSEKRQTIVYENDKADVSITQALPSNMILSQIADKSKTVVYDDDNDISETQAIPSNVILDKKPSVKRQTIVYEDDKANISITQALPSNVILNEIFNKSKTMVYEDDNGEISKTQEIPTNVFLSKKPQKRQTIVYDNDMDDISMTQALPSNVILNEISNKTKTVVYEDDNGDMSITETKPPNVQLNRNSEKRQTMVCEDEKPSVFITQVRPSSVILSELTERKSMFEDNNKDNDIVQSMPAEEILKKSENRKSKVFEGNTCNVLKTQAIPSNLLSENSLGKRKTIVFDDDTRNMSATQALPYHTIQQCASEEPEVKADITLQIKDIKIMDNVDCKTELVTERKVLEKNISITQATPPEILHDPTTTASLKSELSDKSTIIHYYDCDISTTQANILPTNEPNVNTESIEIDENDVPVDVSMTEVSPRKTSVITDCDLEKASISTRQSICMEKERAEVTSQSHITIPNNVDVNKERKSVMFNETNTDKVVDITVNQFNTIQDSEFTNAINNTTNLNLTKAIYSNTDTSHSEFLEKSTTQEKLANVSYVQKIADKSDIFVYQVTQDVSKISNKTKQEDFDIPEIADNGNKSQIKLDTRFSAIHHIPEPINEDILNQSNVHTKEENDSEIKSIDHQIATTYSKDSTIGRNESRISHSETSRVKPKNSILNELLDMSNASMEGGIDDKCVTACIELQNSKEISKTSVKTSSDSMFVITKDSVVEAHIDNDQESIDSSEHPQLDLKSIKPIEFKDDLTELPYKLSPQKRSPERYENVIIHDLQNDNLEKSADMNITRPWKSVKDADNTKELLDMISDFTDAKTFREKNDKVSPVEAKNQNALENKSVIEPRRLSFAPNRQSIVLSREDLLNNISMAQAALQQSRFDIDSTIEDTANSPSNLNESPNSPKKSVRMSNDVVKTLHFEEDESLSDTSMKSTTTTPLKKTAFGETSYMKESKAKVIPTYLKDVSDNIKALMSDLVKPMADVMPFESVSFEPEKSPSTCSTQVQANLATSSQIDVDIELHSNPDSVYEVNRSKKMATDITESLELANKSLKSQVAAISMNVSEREINKEPREVLQLKQSPKTVQGPILVFDHRNPLNNVLLAPVITSTEVHKYDPIESNEGSSPTLSSVMDGSAKEIRSGIERVSIHYNIDNRNHSVLHSGDADTHKLVSDSQISNASKPLSIDRSTCLVAEVKDTETNTLIAMKGNKDLLEASSSLTLVDDVVPNSELKNVIHETEADVSMTEFDPEGSEGSKVRKRSYSPTRNTCSNPNVEITPKPVSKMQKMSNSPICTATTSLETLSSETEPVITSPNSRNSPKNSITVQQLMTEYNIQPVVNQEVLHEEILKILRKSDADVVPSSTNASSVSRRTSQASSKTGWQPDLHEMSSKNLVLECESSVNVVAKIDMLSFMGTRDIEWDTDGGGADTWSFRLLCRRVRLSVRLAHTLHNALRTRVRADTPVLRASVDRVEVSRADATDPLATLCVNLALEAMRYECSRAECSRAGHVPALLRRCATVAGLAFTWARAMRDARLRLAYTVTPDGFLALKVANIPLRSVWEVTMRIELCVGDAREAAWARASSVRVASVLASSAPRRAVEQLAAGVPKDWGHVPKTLWKIFRYLKDKTTEDEDVLGL